MMQEKINTVFVQLHSQFDVWLHKQIFDNEFLVAGVATVALGFLGYIARNIPYRIWNIIKRTFTIELTINSDVDTFLYALEYINKNRIKLLQRTFLLGTSTNSLDIRRDNWTVGPGYGFSAFWDGWSPVIVTLVREDSDSREVKQHFNLRFFGRSTSRIDRFIKRLKKSSQKSDRDTIRIYAFNGYWERVLDKKSKRSLETVFIDKETKANLLERIDWFCANEKWYNSRGMPHKMGILIDGPPGTGKTSLIHAIASKYDRNIRFLNLNNLTDRSASILGKELSSRDILVIEDIDTFAVSKGRIIRYKPLAEERATKHGEPDTTEEKEADTLSLSTVLNVLDGLISPDGVITFGTTNRPEVLDPALTRRGRFDMQITLDLMSGECLAEMFKAFYGKDIPVSHVKKYERKPISGADVQDIFLRYTDDPEGAIESLCDLRKRRKRGNGYAKHENHQLDGNRPGT